MALAVLGGAGLALAAAIVSFVLHHNRRWRDRVSPRRARAGAPR